MPSASFAFPPRVTAPFQISRRPNLSSWRIDRSEEEDHLLLAVVVVVGVVAEVLFVTAPLPIRTELTTRWASLRWRFRPPWAPPPGPTPQMTIPCLCRRSMMAFAIAVFLISGRFIRVLLLPSMKSIRLRAIRLLVLMGKCLTLQN